MERIDDWVIRKTCFDIDLRTALAANEYQSLGTKAADDGEITIAGIEKRVSRGELADVYCRRSRELDNPFADRWLLRAGDVLGEWAVDAWYRMKLRVDVVDGAAQVKGKICPRDAGLPEAWSIEMNDPSPNLEGSPGLYAYSRGITSTPGTEVLFDNIEVISNN